MKLNQSPNDEQIAYLRQRGSLCTDHDSRNEKKSEPKKSVLQAIEDKFTNLLNFGK